MNFESIPTPYRCAVYFAPQPFSDWWLAGSHWLGRCALTGACYAPQDIHGIEPGLFQSLTADPRRYGWHATLKAPFTLAPEKTISDLLEAMQEIADRFPAFTLPPLHISTENNFLALRPLIDHGQINDVAEACVKDLHDLTSPLSTSELQRRRKAPLSARQDQLLDEWGYPWVMEEFKFHMSLTGPLDPCTAKQREALIDAAQLHFQELPACRFDHLALFVEPENGAHFQLIKLVELRQ